MKGPVREPFSTVYGHHHQKEIERTSWNLNRVGAMDAEEEEEATTMTVQHQTHQRTHMGIAS